jgi:hypothetical protein
MWGCEQSYLLASHSSLFLPRACLPLLTRRQRWQGGAETGSFVALDLNSKACKRSKCFSGIFQFLEFLDKFENFASISQNGQF